MGAEGEGEKQLPTECRAQPKIGSQYPEVMTHAMTQGDPRVKCFNRLNHPGTPFQFKIGKCQEGFPKLDIHTLIFLTNNLMFFFKAFCFV